MKFILLFHYVRNVTVGTGGCKCCEDTMHAEQITFDVILIFAPIKSWWLAFIWLTMFEDHLAFSARIVVFAKVLCWDWWAASFGGACGSYLFLGNSVPLQISLWQSSQSKPFGQIVECVGGLKKKWRAAHCGFDFFKILWNKWQKQKLCAQMYRISRCAASWRGH